MGKFGMATSGAGNDPKTGQLQVDTISAGTAKDLFLLIRKDGAWRWHGNVFQVSNVCKFMLAGTCACSSASSTTPKQGREDSSTIAKRAGRNSTTTRNGREGKQHQPKEGRTQPSLGGDAFPCFFWAVLFFLSSFFGVLRMFLLLFQRRCCFVRCCCPILLWCGVVLRYSSWVVLPCLLPSFSKKEM